MAIGLPCIFCGCREINTLHIAGCCCISLHTSHLWKAPLKLLEFLCSSMNNHQLKCFHILMAPYCDTRYKPDMWFTPKTFPIRSVTRWCFLWPGQLIKTNVKNVTYVGVLTDIRYIHLGTCTHIYRKPLSARVLPDPFFSMIFHEEWQSRNLIVYARLLASVEPKIAP